ncbi:hypothetical protein [Chryseolinea lacunae]|uniref:Uncharacterized protein n=1 Tax=Chryseolinea lacunae TaxID=2801331 RepID=A0ABS1KUR4_9BACT|nr:hypothetical protein [Chryseolinea lacunae]MBL0742962.1 hypothetical protein [Chryseolinea lacunae]
MKDRIKVAGVITYDGHSRPCSGTINILNMSDKQMYASWQMAHEGGDAIAGVARNYFVGDKTHTEDELFAKVIADIVNYRILRKRVFSAVTILDL